MKDHHEHIDKESLVRVFLIFLRLGLTSFGGPVAHLGYFRDEFVARRRWLSERSYLDLVALCQFLPGPASSQVGMALGLFRRGYAGAVAAWVGFTLPSAIAMIAFALGIARHESIQASGILHGLKLVAVAIVMQAVWGMGRHLCTDMPRIAIMGIAACISLLLPSATSQVGIIISAGLLGQWLFGDGRAPGHEPLPTIALHRHGTVWLTLFFVLLGGLPILAILIPDQLVAVIAAFYRAGSLVFGGGHVVLPLLQTAVVHPGWLDNETFLSGYAAAQALPGPLFTFAAFLGAAMHITPNGWIGGMLCLLAIFAPSFLLVMGVLPFWEKLRSNLQVQASLVGINAAVVGLLLAALYDPVWTGSIHRPLDVGVALLAFAALIFGKLPSWLVIAGGGIVGWLFTMFL